jgi:hypothetical protein
MKVCHIDTGIPHYIKAGQRVLSTECILSQTCASASLTVTLSVTKGFDLGRRELRRNRSFRLPNGGVITRSQPIFTTTCLSAPYPRSEPISLNRKTFHELNQAAEGDA